MLSVNERIHNGRIFIVLKQKTLAKGILFAVVHFSTSNKNIAHGNRTNMDNNEKKNVHIKRFMLIKRNE